MLRTSQNSNCSASFWKSRIHSSWGGSMTRTQPPDTGQSFEKSAIPLLLALKPSRAQLLVSSGCHIAAVIAIFLSNIPLLVQIIFVAVVVISLCYNYHQDNRSQVLIWRAGNRWVIESSAHSSQGVTDKKVNNSNSGHAATLHSIDFFSRWLVIITLRTEAGRKKKFVIPYDALTENTFRLLRVRLRIEGFRLLNPEKLP